MLSYVQASWQAEATNKILIDMVKKTIEDKPKKCSEILLEIL